MLIFWFLGGGSAAFRDFSFTSLLTERIILSLGRGDRFDIVEAFSIAYLSSALPPHLE